MLLVIDIGNSNITFGVYSAGELIDTFRLATDRMRTADETGLSICQYFAFSRLNIRDIKDAVIASVVPELTEVLKETVQKYLSVEPLTLGENLQIHLTNLYRNPEQTGIDRLVCAVSAVYKYGTPVIILDMGTATTIDAVNAKGEFMGGTIFPGINILAESLSAKTAKLPRIEVALPESIIGKSTEECIRAGVYYGYMGAIDKIVSKMKSEMGGSVKVVATGGLINNIPMCNSQINYTDETLLLDGLKLIYENRTPQDTGS